ncbi:1540_t:CDS:10 [Ambispora leptoticha]|uniref:1540_t:CDS:1 n=1 Tax=Ambispora leptoticha TaxID=144679 RepID=A0A9N9GDF5_9GLOM|nr:1540_t:CDS:10 [Ambispora leptoticha]
MFTAATNAASALQSSIMDTLNSRQNSEVVNSNNDVQGASDPQVDNTSPQDSKSSTISSSTNGEDKSSWQDKLQPTINLDTTVATGTNITSSPQSASLTIEELGTPEDRKKPNRMGSTSTGTTEELSDIIELPPPAQIPKHSPASPKRHKEFHALFRNVPEYDYLIDDYSCALQKEILVQGRLYISVNYVCFNANIFGWVTSLVIPFSDIVSIEKKVTAFVIPNAILISTLHAKHFFASFLARDTVYDLLTNLWRQNRPTLSTTPSYTGSQNDKIGTEASDVDEGEKKTRPLQKKLSKLSLDPIKLILGDQTKEERPQNNSSTSLPLASKPDDSKDEKVTETSKPESGGFSRENSTSDVQKLSNSHVSSVPHKVKTTHGKSSRGRKSTRINTNLKKRIHYPVMCDCLKNRQHYNTTVLDKKYTGSVEKIYNLIFTSGFVRRFLVEQEKCTDVNIGEWVSEPDGKLTRTSSFIKPLNNPMGPKTTKCYLKDECLLRDFDSFVTNLTTTTTPDVPFGGSFCVKTRTCIMWAGPNETRVIVTAAVEFSKSSWLKGTIEKAALEGQQQYNKNLDLAIRKYIAAHPNEFQDECGSPVREVNEVAPDNETQISEARIDKKRGTFDDGELGIIPETSTNLSQAFVDLINALTTIFSSIFRSIRTLSISALIACAFVFMIVVNYYNWLRLTELTRKMENMQSENIDGSHGFRTLKPGDVLYESRRFREYSFDDRVNIEGDLWVWISEKAKKHKEHESDETNTSDFDATSSTFTSDSTSENQASSENNESNSYSEYRQKFKPHFMDYIDHFNDNFGHRAFSWSSNSRRRPSTSSEPPTLNDLHGHIEDLQRLVHAAQYHANKLADIAEEERVYLFQLMKNMLKNSDPPSSTSSSSYNDDKNSEINSNTKEEF